MQCDDKLPFQRVSQICLCVPVIQHNPFTSEFCRRQKSLPPKKRIFPSQVFEKTAANMLAPRNQLSLIRWDIQVGFGANRGQRLASLKIWAQSSICLVLLRNIVFLGNCSLRNNIFWSVSSLLSVTEQHHWCLSRKQLSALNTTCHWQRLYTHSEQYKSAQWLWNNPWAASHFLTSWSFI